MRADKRTVGTAGTANLYRTPWTTLRRRQTSFAVAPRTCHVSRRSRCHRCRHRQPRATSAAVAEAVAVALSTRSPMPAGQKRKIALQIEKTSRKTKRKTENKPQLVRCGTNNGTQTHTSTHTSTHTRVHMQQHFYHSHLIHFDFCAKWKFICIN